MWGTWMSRSPCVETDRHVNNNNTTTASLVGRIAEPFRGRGSLGHCLQACSCSECIFDLLSCTWPKRGRLGTFSAIMCLTPGAPNAPYIGDAGLHFGVSGPRVSIFTPT